MNPAIVIPSYWVCTEASLRSAGAYDHSTPLDRSDPELAGCLASLERVRDLPPVFVLAVCPQPDTERVVERIRRIASEHPSLDVRIISNNEASLIARRVGRLAPAVGVEPVSLRGYGAIRNAGLAVCAIFGHDVAVFLDDDEQVLSPDFMERALFGLRKETRQRLPILAKSGYFLDRSGSPFADTAKSGVTSRWWTKRIEFNKWMSGALRATRISRSNYVCGGCFAVHADAFRHVPFDPYITRGEDLDYLFNMRLQGMDVWFDNTWKVRHLPPKQAEKSPRFMQNVYRWYYERAKLAFASRRPDLVPVTSSSLMPYPGPWISSELDFRVRRTAFARALLTREHRGYWYIWRHGIEDAQGYARKSAGRYLRLISFWPSIMDGLWCDSELAERLEER